MALAHVSLSPPPTGTILVEDTTRPIKNTARNSNTWTNWFSNLWEKVAGIRSYTAALTPALVAANTTAQQTFSVPGLRTTDVVIVNKPSLNAGIGIVGYRVSATDTLAITYGNFTAGGLTPSAETYDIIAIKKDLL